MNDFDKRKMSLKEVMPYIDKLMGKEAYAYALALVSLSGWSAEAIDYVEKRAEYPVILVEKYFNRVNLDLKKFLYYV